MPVYISVSMQHLTQSKTGLRTCNMLPGAACSPSAPPPLQYRCRYCIFLKLDSAPRQGYCCIYIYIYIHNPQASSTVVALPTAWLMELRTHAPLRTRVPLVHHFIHIYIIFKLPQQLLWHHSLPRRGSPLKKLPQLSCTTPYSCTSSAPLVLVHLSCTTPYSCTSRAPLHTRAPLVHLSCITPYWCTSSAPLVLVHLPCTTPYSCITLYSCTTLDHRRGRPTIFR